jgi:hypothetical protein
MTTLTFARIDWIILDFVRLFKIERLKKKVF